MKCLIIVFLLIMIFPLRIYPQVFNAGFVGGITASQVDGDSYSGYNKLGFHAGVFVSAPLLPLLNARMEIRYCSRGAANPASDDNTGYYKMALHYIDLPVMGAVHVKKLGDVEIGLIPGYLFAKRGEDDNGKMPDEYLVDFKKFDLGLLLGVNVNVTQKMSVHFRYSYSFFSIRDQETAGSYYSWFGKIFGYSQGDFNNYLSLGASFKIR